MEKAQEKHFNDGGVFDQIYKNKGDEVKEDEEKRVLPGFGLSLGFTMLYMSLFVLIPLSIVFIQTSQLGWKKFAEVVTSERVLHSYQVSLTTSLAAAVVNAIFGLLIAWVLVRYTFPGKRLLDGLIDLPFALPTAVAGITLTTLYAENGWVGKIFSMFHIKVALRRSELLLHLRLLGYRLSFEWCNQYFKILIKK